jgi:hypothetical protein
MRTSFSSMLVALALVLASAAGAHAQTPGVALTPLNGADYLQHYMEGRMYQEAWTYVVQTKAGDVLYLNFIVTNIGVTSGASAFSFSLSPAGGGPVVFRKFEKGQDEFVQSPGSLSIKVGPWSSAFGLGTKPTTVKGAEDDVAIDLTIAPWVPGVKIGKGVWTYKDKRWLHMIQVPRGTTSGALKVAGKTWDLAGDAYVDHAAQDFLSPEVTGVWNTMRLFAPDHTVLLLQFKVKPDFGGGMAKMLIVSDRKGFLAASTSYSHKGSATKADPEGCARAGRVDVSMKEGAVSLEGGFSEARLHERNAVLDKLGWAQRQVAKLVTDQVVIYRQLNDYDFTLDLGVGVTVPLKGRGLSEYICPKE